MHRLVHWGKMLTGKIDGEENNSHSLGADVIGENLDGVANKETRPGDIVED